MGLPQMVCLRTTRNSIACAILRARPPTNRSVFLPLSPALRSLAGEVRAEQFQHRIAAQPPPQPPPQRRGAKKKARSINVNRTIFTDGSADFPQHAGAAFSVAHHFASPAWGGITAHSCCCIAASRSPGGLPVCVSPRPAACQCLWRGFGCAGIDLVRQHSMASAAPLALSGGHFSAARNPSL